jgi:hypothetical protein
MVSDDTDWSSGASGIALDAEIAARLRPIANAEAASSFTNLSFPVGVRDEIVIFESCHRDAAGFTSDDGANGDASPSDAGASGASDGANADASDGPSALVRA